MKFRIHIGAINIKSLIQLAKERKEGDNDGLLQSSAGSTPLSERIEQITKMQEEREKQDIYPTATEDVRIPDKLQFRKDDNVATTNRLKADSDSFSDFVDPKKSLTQALAEDTEIDHSRFVDPESGNTGALYEHVPASNIKGMEDWIPESDHYKYYPTTTDFPLKVAEENEFRFPENLCLYTYEMGNCADFKSPKKCLTGL